MLAVTIFGLSVPEALFVAGVIVTVAAYARDWRPIRSLRNENRELREVVSNRDEKIKELEQKVQTLEGEVAELKKATDLSVLQREHAAFMELIQGLIAEVKGLDGAVRSNTAAVELIAKKDAIDDALSERRPA